MIVRLMVRMMSGFSSDKMEVKNQISCYLGKSQALPEKGTQGTFWGDKNILFSNYSGRFVKIH